MSFAKGHHFNLKQSFHLQGCSTMAQCTYLSLSAPAVQREDCKRQIKLWFFNSNNDLYTSVYIQFKVTHYLQLSSEFECLLPPNQ